MKTNITRKREIIELCTLKPGDTFIPDDFDDSYIFMVVNTNSADKVNLDFDKDDIIGICLNDGEIIAFGSKELGFKVNGAFKGEY